MVSSRNCIIRNNTIQEKAFLKDSKQTHSGGLGTFNKWALWGTAKSALQRQCQTLEALCPITNVQDYCASQIFWFCCSSDCWEMTFFLWSSVTHPPPNRDGLQQLFSNEQNQSFPTTQTTQREVRIVQPRSVPDQFAISRGREAEGCFCTSRQQISEAVLRAQVGRESIPRIRPPTPRKSSPEGRCHVAPSVPLVEGSSSFQCVQIKTWTLGRSPVSPPMVLNFKKTKQNNKKKN